ncbi:MAG: hypothetical protein ACI8W8_000771 [Rhodothermales bacterium]|jgi:hypothetical protein
MESLDRFQIRFTPLAERENRVDITRDHVAADAEPGPLTEHQNAIMAKSARAIRSARERKAAVMLTFGAHAIKNGLGPVINALMADGWVTHLATNGAGVIHDWEFAYLGKSSEHVAENVANGQFGLWEETGFCINLAIAIGAWQGLGYGESVGAMIANNGLEIPTTRALRAQVEASGRQKPQRAAAALDLAWAIDKFELPHGLMEIPHPYAEYSVQATAYRLGVPFTSHPMFGHDIIYTHPMSIGAAIGRTAERDFLRFAQSVSQLEHGVYMSVGSAVMSPMVFEKSLSMAQNLALQSGEPLRNHKMLVVDLARSEWDWSKGEPPESDPAYYLRYCKSFSRMGGEMQYLSADNRDFLLALRRELA